MAVCIVLVNYRGHNDTIECLESILKSSYDRFQVVVVDNSEGEDDILALQQWARGDRPAVSTSFDDLVFPLEKKPLSFRTFGQDDLRTLTAPAPEKVLFVKASRNNGFASGNNIAIDYASRVKAFEYVWLLNNDTVVQKDTLTCLVTCGARQAANVGIIGCKLRQYHNPDRLQAVGALYYKWIGKVRELAAGEVDRGQWDAQIVNANYVIGASMFVTKAFIAAVGPMEEDYFIYFEELDWCLRGKEKGFTVAFCPQAIVFHKLGATTGSQQKTSEISDFYSIRNRILIARKFFPISLITLYPAFAMFIVNRLRKGMPERIALLFRVLMNPRKHYKRA
ncbi:MAG TPA: glycosyltransferase family 2 protein [Cyclobacteriaceae bacterium]|nr:glycosyltransferase family 2 protein [Cyclobacteriaceae bacterium]